jgi:hypothetical protein
VTFIIILPASLFSLQQFFSLLLLAIFFHLFFMRFFPAIQIYIPLYKNIKFSIYQKEKYRIFWKWRVGGVGAIKVVKTEPDRPVGSVEPVTGPPSGPASVQNRSASEPGKNA